MKDPTVWADSKCSQRPKKEPAEDWNVQEDFHLPGGGRT